MKRLSGAANCRQTWDLAGFVNLRHGRLGSLRYFVSACWEEVHLARRDAVAELGRLPASRVNE
jgi:hypothetical protein